MIHDNWITMLPPPVTGVELPPEPVRPVSAKENLERFYRKQKPFWLPVATEGITIIPEVVCERPALNRGGKDWFGVEWTFVDAVGVPSVMPGFQLFSEVEDWRESVTFPDLDAIDWEASAKQTMEYIDPTKMTTCVLFNGCFERLHCMMGFEDALCAMAAEPEETLALLNAIADHKIRLIDKLLTYYPIDRFLYHDDWGTQRSAFFSNEMFLELLYEPTKRIVDYVHSRGALFTLHSCGRVEALVPYMVEMGIDSWEATQMDINDLPGLKKRFAGELNIETMLVDPIIEDPNASETDIKRVVREVALTLGEGGGLCFVHLGCHPYNMKALHEAYYEVSRELYGN